jgi:hypothetical protein
LKTLFSAYRVFDREASLAFYAVIGYRVTPPSNSTVG